MLVNVSPGVIEILSLSYWELFQTANGIFPGGNITTTTKNKLNGP
jgi:hypothetical protein